MSKIPKLLKPLVPQVGQVWLWEPEKRHARQRVVVTAVEWNGEEVWIESENIGIEGGGRYWNDLSRWVEATVFEGWADGGSET
jgi:hypothetical protein